MNVIATVFRKKGNTSSSLSSRLVSKKPKFVSSVGTQTFHNVSDQLSRFDNQLRAVRSDSNSEFHPYRDGISDKSQHCQGSSSKSPETTSVNSGLLSKETSISQSFPVSLGTDQCGLRLCNAMQITSPTITNVFARPIATPYTAVTSPNQGDQIYCVSPQLVETGVNLNLSPYF